jgi:hypothetical protein
LKESWFDLFRRGGQRTARGGRAPPAGTPDQAIGQPFNARRIAIRPLIWKKGRKIKRDQAASDRWTFGGDFAGSPL